MKGLRSAAFVLLAVAIIPVGNGDAAQAPHGRVAGPPRTFFVSPTGSDSSKGTAKRPWKTIQKALNTLRPGQRALVRPGTYGRARCERGKGGSAARGYVTIKAASRNKPVITDAADGVLWVNCDYLRVEGFLIAGPAVVGGTNVYGLAGSDHVQIVGNEIRNSVCQGIALSPESASWAILRNWIHDNGHGCDQQAHGIYLQGDGHLVANNLIDFHPEGYGIQNYPYSRGVRLVNNTIAHSGRGGMVLGGSRCGASGCGVTGTLVANNILAYNGSYGIVRNKDAPSACAIHSNLAWGNRSGPYASGWPAGCEGRNLAGDPLFRAQERRDYRLHPRSPAVDAGDKAAAVSPAFDGVARPRGKRPDIGAYER